MQANPILTALNGKPLREAPGWVAMLTIVLAGIATPLPCLEMCAARAFAFGLLLAAAYAPIAQAAFATRPK